MLKHIFPIKIDGKKENIFLKKCVLKKTFFFACAFFCTFTLPGDFIYYNYTLNTNLPGTNLNSIYKTFHTAYATFQPPHDVFATSTHPISTNLPWERGHYFGTHTLKPKEARITNWSVCTLLGKRVATLFGKSNGQK